MSINTLQPTSMPTSISDAESRAVLDDVERASA
jgi:hypothetical protein